MTADTPTAPPPLPQSGGSYERQDDGSLKRAGETPPAAAPEMKRGPKPRKEG